MVPFEDWERGISLEIELLSICFAIEEADVRGWKNVWIDNDSMCLTCIGEG